MLRVVTDEPTREEPPRSVLDELVREGARRMLAVALEAEVDAYIEAHGDERDERGRRLVVRNGHAEPRTITTGAGPIEIEAPRVNDRRIDEETGERMRFRSLIIPRRLPADGHVLTLGTRLGTVMAPGKAPATGTLAMPPADIGARSVTPGRR
jgi:putative transposase